MRERWNSQRTDGSSDSSTHLIEPEPQFGWNPPAQPAEHDGAAQTSATVAGSSYPDPDAYVPDQSIFRVLEPEPPEEIPTYQTRTGEQAPHVNGRSAARGLPRLAVPWPGAPALYRRLPHLVVIAVAVAMVLGSGFWQHERTVVMPGGTDTIRSVSDSLYAQEPFGTRENLVASTSDDILKGYLTTGSLSVTPQQLGVQTYVTDLDQSIADVAAEVGRSEETLLWANDYKNPARTLPSGTQLRIPPTDGMLHVVNDSDTLESIAARYGVEPDAITGYEPNGIEHSADLIPNRMIMVPGGSMPMRDEVIFYTVREGDVLWQIADRFGLQSSSIIWANDLGDARNISPGQQLAIPPTDGVMVEAQEGDTVESLAEEWGVEPSAIRDWPPNGLGTDGSLVPGESIMIPGGAPPQPEPEAPAVAAEPAEPAEPAPEESQPAPPPEPEPAQSRVGTGRFVWPTTGVITQYFHASHNGWDIASRAYTDIWAADSGTVTFAGWNNYGLGYAVAVDHGNGYVTWYGHMAEHPPVRVGQWVEQGQYLGPMGSTGYSTGPHIHFVVVYNGTYQDPGIYLQ